MRPDYDVVIVGGGPAGLSAALIAGRAVRHALVIDGGAPRNNAAPAMHSYLSRDGILPHEFRAAAHAELARYTTVERRVGFVGNIEAKDQRLIVKLADGTSVSAVKVILALGLVDRLPSIDGLASNWGRGVHHCPFCDGFEHRGGHWGILVEDPAMLTHAYFLQSWAGTLTVMTNGKALPDEELVRVEQSGIRIVQSPIARVQSGDGHSIAGVVLADGSRVAVNSLWIRPVQEQVPLVRKLGLPLTESGAIQRDEMGETVIPGLHAAGDCAAGPMQQALLAAADGGRIMLALAHSIATANFTA